MIFFRWTRPGGENFFFWLGAVSFVLFLLLFRERRRVIKSMIDNPPKTEIRPGKIILIDRKKTDEAARVKEFRAFIHKIAEEKGIEIKFSHRAGNGHMDFPEKWIIARPIPLDPDELYKLAFYEDVAGMRLAPNKDGIVYARQFYFEDGERIEYIS